MGRYLVLVIALATFCAASAPPACASVSLREASIAEGEIFEFSPFAYEVRFSEQVQLVNARLIDQEGRETPLDLRFYQGRRQSFVIELPVLVPHGYRLSWRIRGTSGPDQQGSVGFVVKGCIDPPAAQLRAGTVALAVPPEALSRR